MSPPAWGLVLVCGGAALFWAIFLGGGIVHLLQVRRLENQRPPEPAPWPRLSVVVAARDEADTLGPALRSLLAQDYPALEVVFVDDRSADGTGDLADRLAGEDPRLRVVHVRELPAGWLGKVHALDRGIRAVSGEWFLFTDADVHFAPGALRLAVALAEARGLDHLVLMPDVTAGGFLHRVLLHAFFLGYLLITDAVRAEKGGRRAFAGAGAFNLVRRSAFDRTPGFGWLRMEVVDDAGLGLMLKGAGARQGFYLASAHARVRWYASPGDMVRGLEKNAFSMARYRAARALIGQASVWALLLAPAAALLPWGVPRLWLAAAVPASFLAAWAAVETAVTGDRSGAAFALPLGLAAIAFAGARSAWKCLRRGGIVWRGTFYPLEELRRGQRVKL
jgi:GT2 family glycosyltransferase